MGKCLALTVAGLLALAAIGCGQQSERTAGEPASDPAPVHVHGLGVNPRDGALFIATHTGLFRAPPGGQRATRVAGRYQDTMGFTVVGPDSFLGSGHPDLREKLPPFLGLIRSNDAGETWTPVSLVGKADFHILEALGKRLYGFGADFQTRREQLLVSRDGGRRWSPATLPARLVSLTPIGSYGWRVLRPGGRVLLLEHVRSPSTPVRAVQRMLDPLAIRIEGDHLTREPLEYLEAEGIRDRAAQALEVGDRRARRRQECRPPVGSACDPSTAIKNGAIAFEHSTVSPWCRRWCDRGKPLSRRRPDRRRSAVVSVFWGRVRQLLRRAPNRDPAQLCPRCFSDPIAALVLCDYFLHSSRQRPASPANSITG
jgi:hypothetical protein